MITSIVRVVTGWIKIKGATDGTKIGNVKDSIKTASTFQDTMTINPNGRLRVAEAHSVFESFFPFDKKTLIWDESITGSATSTHNSTKRLVSLNVGTASGNKIIRQTKRRVRYHPGRPLSVKLTQKMAVPVANLRQRFGYFDGSDGFYFEASGITYSFVRLTSSGETSGPTFSVSQNSWNVDKMDGTGPSGKTLDLTKVQLFFVDFIWQSVGRIRFGFYIDGEYYVCHQMLIANTNSFPSIAYPNLPVRYEIENLATNASGGVLEHICSCVESESLESASEGQTRNYTTSTLKTVSSGTGTPVISIRLNSTYIKAIVDIVRTVMYTQTADDVTWRITLNPTLTGATWAINSGQADLDIAATAMSGGTVLDSGFISQNNSNEQTISSVIDSINTLLGATISGTSDILTISGSSRTGTADVLASVTWKEF